MMGQRGVDATSFSAVLAASGAPRGSVYHYFPEGKQQLVEGAVEWTTHQVLAHQHECTATTPGGVVEHFASFFRRSLEGSQCRAGCPIAAVVVGAYAHGETLSSTIRTGLESWSELLAAQFVECGLDAVRARSLAWTTLAAVEGSLILCRAERTVDPLDAVVEELRTRADAVSRRGRTG